MVTRAAARGLHTEDLRLDQWRRLLGAYDYQRQLERGYSVTRDASGAVVRTVAGLSPGTALRTLVSDGQVSSTVTSVEVREDNDRDDLDGGMQ
jgi:exodeoxyribonuclease VII large subunit